MEDARQKQVAAARQVLAALRTAEQRLARALHQRAIDFHLGPDAIRVRRMLERPFGSVRWKEDTPDRAANEVLPVVATAAGSST